MKGGGEGERKGDGIEMIDEKGGWREEGRRKKKKKDLNRDGLWGRCMRKVEGGGEEDL